MLDQDASVDVMNLCSATGTWMKFLSYYELLIETKRLHAHYPRNPHFKNAPDIQETLDALEWVRLIEESAEYYNSPLIV